MDSGPRANTHSFFHGAWPAAAAARSGMPLSLQAVAARVDAGGWTLVRAVLAVHDQPWLDDVLSSGMPLSLPAVAAQMDAGELRLLAGLAALHILTEDTSKVT